jgi:F-type H+-transporting ATPase subunit epsilon
MSFQLSILTPSGKVFEDTVDSVAAPGLEGGFEVYGQHQPFLAALQAGAVKVRKPEGNTIFKIDSGVLEVMANHNVLILADRVLAE